MKSSFGDVKFYNRNDSEFERKLKPFLAHIYNSLVISPQLVYFWAKTDYNCLNTVNGSHLCLSMLINVCYCNPSRMYIKKKCITEIKNESFTINHNNDSCVSKRPWSQETYKAWWCVGWFRMRGCYWNQVLKFVLKYWKVQKSITFWMKSWVEGQIQLELWNDNHPIMKWSRLLPARIYGP